MMAMRLDEERIDRLLALVDAKDRRLVREWLDGEDATMHELAALVLLAQSGQAKMRTALGRMEALLRKVVAALFAMAALIVIVLVAVLFR